MSNIIISISDNTADHKVIVNAVPKGTSYSLIGKGGKQLRTEKDYSELASIFSFVGQSMAFNLVPGGKKYTFKKIPMLKPN
jgi:hypothetical protein